MKLPQYRKVVTLTHCDIDLFLLFSAVLVFDHRNHLYSSYLVCINLQRAKNQMFCYCEIDISDCRYEIYTEFYRIFMYHTSKLDKLFPI